MIFVTIGTQGPFDRLVKAIDEIAFEMPEIEFIAQTMKGSYKPKNMKSFDFLSPSEFNNYFLKAQLIVSHAGMGTIISALVNEKPIIIVPRLLANKEHRSDHQVATARAFGELEYVNIAYNKTELSNKVKTLVRNPICLHKTGNFASNELIQELKDFIAKS